MVRPTGSKIHDCWHYSLTERKVTILCGYSPSTSFLENKKIIAEAGLLQVFGVQMKQETALRKFYES